MVHEGSNSQPIILRISQTFKPLLFISIDFLSLCLMCNLAFVLLFCYVLKLFHVWYTLQSTTSGRMT